MKIISVTKNDEGRRVDAFLKKIMPEASFGLIYKYIRTNKIKVNGKKPKENQRLSEGDEIKFFGDENLLENKKFVPEKYSLNIIYEDANILIVNKPALLACQPDKQRKSGTLVDYIKSYLYEKGEYAPEKENSFAPALCNRIDFNTKGIVIAAKNLAALRIVNEKLKTREIHKFYICRVKGKPVPPKGIIKGEIKKEESTNKSGVVNKGGKYAETHYRTIKTEKESSVLEVEIITGRSHQIRVHLSSIGCPIMGDPKYAKDGGKEQQLVSYKTVFDFKIDAGQLQYLNGKSFEIENPLSFL